MRVPSLVLVLGLVVAVTGCSGSGGPGAAAAPASPAQLAAARSGHESWPSHPCDARDEDCRDEAPHGPPVSDDAMALPNGTFVTPTAVPGTTIQQLNPGLASLPGFVAGQPISLAMSPDRTTLAVLTSGYNNNYDEKGNLIPAASGEYVFIFDVTSAVPVQKQVLQIPDSYVGLSFTPDGKRLLASGGGDDALHVFAKTLATFGPVSGSPFALGHLAGPSSAPPVSKSAVGLAQGPMAQGIAVTADSAFAVVANRYNDSISVVNLSTGAVAAELDLRPGKSGGAAGVAGGEYPNSVAIVGSSTAFVSSERDREIVVVNLSNPGAPSVTTRIPVTGIPNRMVLDATQATLYVACDNSDLVTVIDTAGLKVEGTISTVAPAHLHPHKYKGASPNALALSPDGRRLYVTNRGTNAVAVIDLSPRHRTVVGLLPTGWYPSDVAVSADGATLYVVNLKTIPGPNPGNCLGYQTVPCPVSGSPVTFAPNEYVFNLTKGGLATMPVPTEASTLDRLTLKAAANAGFTFAPSRADTRVMDELRRRVKHVIYVVKENRTYDQVLGDLGRGNGDPSLTEFPRGTTPNLHAAAERFVTLDNFYDAGDVSGNGWPWSTSARESDAGAKMLPVNYACSPLTGTDCSTGLPLASAPGVGSYSRGGSYDWEGTNRNINVGLSGAARSAENPLYGAFYGGDPDVLPGTANVAAPDGPDGEEGQGYLWSAALRAGLSVRNYGFFADLTLYSIPASVGGIICNKASTCDRTPFASGKKQAYSSNAELGGPSQALTDQYFRGFDAAYPDYYRVQEWAREFQGYVAGGNLPALSLVRLMADHTGAYGRAVDGVNTPDRQVADNDYAVGQLLEAVAGSPYAKDTLVFVVEDDAQDGPDHVDAHRSTAFVVGPYVKQGAVVSRHYTTVNLLRTITEVLGLDHLSVFDATQAPMTEVFDLSQRHWSFTAKPSTLLAGTQLPIAPSAFTGLMRKPARPASYWIEKTRGFDFSVEDRVDALAYNRILWEGLMHGRPYPAAHGAATAGRVSATSGAKG
jgi:YVTN family beta-propeller protein